MQFNCSNNSTTIIPPIAVANKIRNKIELSWRGLNRGMKIKIKKKKKRKIHFLLQEVREKKKKKERKKSTAPKHRDDRSFYQFRTCSLCLSRALRDLWRIIRNNRKSSGGRARRADHRGCSKSESSKNIRTTSAFAVGLPLNQPVFQPSGFRGSTESLYRFGDRFASDGRNSTSTGRKGGTKKPWKKNSLAP